MFAAREPERRVRGEPAGVLYLAAHLDAAGLGVRVGGDLHSDRASELVALAAGVLARGLGELAQEEVAVLGEQGMVALAQGEGERVRNDTIALGVDVAMIVDLAEQPATQLDGLDAGTGPAGEHALDHTLHTTLEGLQCHDESRLVPGLRWLEAAPPHRSRRVSFRFPGRYEPRSVGVEPCWAVRWALLACRHHSGEWRNRQTRWLQVPVFERVWGFKSPLAHTRPLRKRGPLPFSRAQVRGASAVSLARRRPHLGTRRSSSPRR